MDPIERALPPLERINYDSPLAIQRVLAQRGLGALKRYGQNFLVNRNFRKELLDALDFSPGATVWEIGPGLGAMTEELLERGAKLVAFEIDRGYVALLQELFGAYSTFTLIPGDVLRTWKVAEPADYFFGNLPYNIAATLLGNLIEGNTLFMRMVITVQREVAQRISASPGSRDYSSITVLCNTAYRVRPLRVMSGNSFFPRPRVDSQGIQFDIRTDRDPAQYSLYLRPLIRALFVSRRKTVYNTLRTYLAALSPSLERDDMAVTLLRNAGIPPQERPERLATDDFIALAQGLERAYPFGSGRQCP